MSQLLSIITFSVLLINVLIGQSNYHQIKSVNDFETSLPRDLNQLNGSIQSVKYYHSSSNVPDTVLVKYDSAGKLIEWQKVRSNKELLSQQFMYLQNDNIERIVNYSNGDVSAVYFYNYDSLGNPESCYRKTFVYGIEVSKAEYEISSKGNIKKILFFLGADSLHSTIITFDYDTLNRLVSSQCKGKIWFFTEKLMQFEKVDMTCYDQYIFYCQEAWNSNDTYSYTCKYNDLGNITEEKLFSENPALPIGRIDYYYDEEGKIQKREQFQLNELDESDYYLKGVYYYNEKGLPYKSIWSNSSTKSKAQINIKYQYDDHDNWTERKISVEGDDRSDWIDYREFTYY